MCIFLITLKFSNTNSDVCVCVCFHEIGDFLKSKDYQFDKRFID